MTEWSSQEKADGICHITFRQQHYFTIIFFPCLKQSRCLFRDSVCDFCLCMKLLQLDTSTKQKPLQWYIYITDHSWPSVDVSHLLNGVLLYVKGSCVLLFILFNEALHVSKNFKCTVLFLSSVAESTSIPQTLKQKQKQKQNSFWGCSHDGGIHWYLRFTLPLLSVSKL